MEENYFLSSSNCRTVSKLDVDNPLIGALALDNTSYLTLDTYAHNSHNNDDIYYCDNESLQTTDQSFVIFDKTPPKPYIALTWPETGNRARKTKELGVLEWNKDERSLITEEISIYFKDLSGLLDSTSGLYKGYDNLVFNNGSSGLISTAKCSTSVYLTDNSSNYTKCYPAMSFGDFSTGSGMFNDNRTSSLTDIPIRPINNEIENFSGTRYGYS